VDIILIIPNLSAFIRYSRHGLAAGVAAFRDIEPGEEISISCMDAISPRQRFT
jgi:hypothetical protein